MEAGNYENNVVETRSNLTQTFAFTSPHSHSIPSFLHGHSMVGVILLFRARHSKHAHTQTRALSLLSVPNDLSLTKRFLMHIFYFTSCNYDKLLKTVNGIHTQIHTESVCVIANAAWQNQRNKITEKNLAKTKHKEVEKKECQNITKCQLLVDGRIWRNREKNESENCFGGFQSNELEVKREKNTQKKTNEL